ncbi:Rim4p KNAG_0I03040 [Huiozyma naganishii CBS 8797]|uniref:RRM domain-containing protein n=1 Tax=Huiozyma naganishii (strain ATCC MYA-139 / BCRC 22969 / CBS 8797 / KCTC 17520 / NBRC 10181 / NCYC 3082 / Yp74L-3) TaxID=1071383 RepID=J7RQM1_HUIN7|nr:hypothetical protein KNAG_0I03040 [Kazachstania naganishii CBS 8797]CCK72088.1 hypothetical protein KNAG_0I03040 [Kazachstania naganishii CBS 8797]
MVLVSDSNIGMPVKDVASTPVKLNEEGNCVINEGINDLLPDVCSSLEESDEDSDCTSSDGADPEGNGSPEEREGSEKDKNAPLPRSEINPKSTVPSKTSHNDLRGRPSACVFVASLAATLSDDELCLSVTEKFAHYGGLNGVKVLRDQENRPYAFVQYATDKDAKNALRMAHGSKLNGRIIRCEPARVNRTLFISCHMPTSFADLEKFCSKFGELEQVVPGKDSGLPIGRKNLGYPITKSASWFIQFVYRDDAIRAFANIKTELSWNVQWAQNVNVPKHYNLVAKSQDEEGSPVPEMEEEEKVCIDKNSIFVGQLHTDTDEDSLKRHFSVYGNIVSLTLIHKITNVFAFIEFDTEKAASAALEKENHSIFLNKTIHVQYKEIGGLHSRRNSRRFSNGGKPNNNSFHDDTNYGTPQLNLAPPPINMYRRRSHASGLPPFRGFAHGSPGSTKSSNGYPSFTYNPKVAPYRRVSYPENRTTSSDMGDHTRERERDDKELEEEEEEGNEEHEEEEVDPESDYQEGDGSKGTDSIENDGDISESQSDTNMHDYGSAGTATGTSTTTYDRSSAGNYPRHFKRRYSYNEMLKYNNDPNLPPYYFPQHYYYAPMPYPMGPPGTSHGGQPYSVVYPFQHPTGQPYMQPPGPPFGPPGPHSNGNMMPMSVPRVMPHGVRKFSDRSPPFRPGESNEEVDKPSVELLDY